MSGPARSRTHCTRYAIALIAWLLAPLAGAADADLVIRNARIISGVTPQPTAPTDVAVANGRIIQIGEYAEKAESEIDANGQYLVPGLIDAHVHLRDVPGFNGDPQQHAELLAEANRQIPRSYLYFGFTTLLDLASGPASMQGWNEHPEAPTALYCSPVTIPNGYPLAWLDEHEQFQPWNLRYMLFDERQAEKYPADFDPEQHTPTAVVDKAVADGASCIKFYFETGFGRLKDLPVPTITLARKLVAAAHQYNLPVFLHGNAQTSYEFGMAAGVDAMAHGMWHWSDLSLDDPNGVNEFARNVASKGIAVQPTIQVIFGEKEMFNPGFFDTPQARAAIPPALIAWYQTDAGQWMKQELANNFPPTDDPTARYQQVANAYDKPINQVSTLSTAIAQHGGQLHFGSDTPSGPFYTQFPGINARQEMDRWIEAGQSAEALFVAMTLSNARLLKMEAEIGSVEVGKQADLLLLKGNPLESVEAYDSITTVLLDGQVIEREGLGAQ
ncbi:amidohydrolase family protein [Marinihelvus fidelis]|nr:amidohydrolase family protein [Marinihelvus fidelis]